MKTQKYNIKDNKELYKVVIWPDLSAYYKDTITKILCY